MDCSRHALISCKRMAALQQLCKCQTLTDPKDNHFVRLACSPLICFSTFGAFCLMECFSGLAPVCAWSCGHRCVVYDAAINCCLKP